MYKVRVMDGDKVVMTVENVPYETISLIIQSGAITVEDTPKRIRHVSIGLQGEVKILLP